MSNLLSEGIFKSRYTLPRMPVRLNKESSTNSPERTNSPLK